VAVVSVEGRDRIKWGLTFEDWEGVLAEDKNTKVLPSNGFGVEGSGDKRL
jgi:hypothetical protein